MTILHIDSSILGGYSVSRSITADLVAKLLASDPGQQVIRRDLVVDAALHLTPDHLAVFQGAAPASPSFGQDVALGGSYIDDIFAADTIVIGAPMYNFSIPTQLKGWIDRVLVANRTFKYTEHGAEGLVPAGKKVYIVSTRGGVFTGASPFAKFDFQEPFLTFCLNFIGLKDVTVIRAEGLSMGEQQKAATLANVKDEIAALAA